MKPALSSRKDVQAFSASEAYFAEVLMGGKQTNRQRLIFLRSFAAIHSFEPTVRDDIIVQRDR